MKGGQQRFQVAISPIDDRNEANGQSIKSPYWRLRSCSNLVSSFYSQAVGLSRLLTRQSLPLILKTIPLSHSLALFLLSLFRQHKQHTTAQNTSLSTNTDAPGWRSCKFDLLFWLSFKIWSHIRYAWDSLAVAARFWKAADVLII